MLMSCAVVVLAAVSQREKAGRAVSHVDSILDLAMLTIIGVGCYVFAPVFADIRDNYYTLSSFDVWIASLAVGSIIVLGRRAWGWPITIVALVFLAYLVHGHLLPQNISHFELKYPRIIETVWYSYEGIFGQVIGVTISIILVYLVFGLILEATGAGESLLKFAFVMTSRLRGRPAHAAIVASGFFGSMSGSTVANVVGTGSFTIPMMKKRGFTPTFAGGIEATASSGGQIVPPVLGTAAFVMADLIGVGYATIATAALVPAFLYYFNLFTTVVIESRRQGIETTPVDERPKLEAADVVKSVSFLIPIAAIIYTLAARLGLAEFVVPFIFAYNPTLLLVETFEPMQFVLVLSSSLLSFYLIATCLSGFEVRRLNSVEIGLRAIAAALLLFDGQLALVGLALAAVSLAIHYSNFFARITRNETS